MTRFAHVLVTATYLVAAATFGLALLRFGLVGAQVGALAGALAALAAVQIHVFAAARASRRALGRRLDALHHAHELLVEEAEAARGRLTAAVEALSREAETRHAELVADMGAFEGKLRDVGREMNAELARARRQVYQTPNPTSGDRAVLLAMVREALEAGRIDLQLQPIVSLPQRKTYFYESFTRVRDGAGDVIAPTQWLSVAEPAGLVGAIDNLLLFRCVQIVRRLGERDRRVGIFCNISPASLADEAFFPQFFDFIREYADLAGSLFFEISQRDYDNRCPVAARNMLRLADFGFRFSIDKVERLDVDPAELKRAGVKFFKAPCALLLEQLTAGRALGLSVAPDVRAEDYARLLAKYGVELVAEKVETEAAVVEILELDIALGQGHLFGPPRPVREEILAAAHARPAIAADDADAA